jgi:hypothetical protein
MADLIAGRQTCRGLRRRLPNTFEAGLAWQLASIEITHRIRGSAV